MLMTLPDEIKEFVIGAVLAAAIGLSSLVFFFYGPAIDVWWRQNWWIVALVAVVIIFLVVRRVLIRIRARRKKGNA
jgi:ABC-type cobalamin transport system permease subunit